MRRRSTGEMVLPQSNSKALRRLVCQSSGALPKRRAFSLHTPSQSQCPESQVADSLLSHYPPRTLATT